MNERPARRGRPSSMTPGMVARICQGLASGLPLDIVCQGEGMPAARSVRRWMASEPTVRRAVLLARLSGAEVFLWQAKLIADDGSQDLRETPEGIAGNVLAVERARLEIKTRLSLFRCWWPGGLEALEAELATVPVKREPEAVPARMAGRWTKKRVLV